MDFHCNGDYKFIYEDDNSGIGLVLDIDEQRTWCIVKYSLSMDEFNSAITLMHLLIPFSINLFSTMIMIILIAQSRSNVQANSIFREHFQTEFETHKHHLIAVCVLILLVLPRLIMSFISGCMKSPHYSWFFLFCIFHFVSTIDNDIYCLCHAIKNF